VKIQYKNETDEIVNIRGKKLRPGDSIVSQVFIKHFEEDVKNGKLTIYINGTKIDFEQIPAVEEEIVNNDPVDIPARDEVSDLTKTDETVSFTETEIPEAEIEIDKLDASTEQQDEEPSAEISTEETAEVQAGTEQESDVDQLRKNAESVPSGADLEDDAVNDVQEPESANEEVEVEETVPEAEISTEETADNEADKAE
jgi:hypothetical protein